MRKILIISVLFNIVFSFFIVGMQQPEVTGVERELFEAIEKGNVARVEKLIDEGVNFRPVQMYEGKEIYPLDFAKEKGNSDIIHIIEMAKYLTFYDRFFLAIQGGDIPKIDRIIINGAIGNINVPKDKDGNTALILAVQKKDVPLVQHLLLLKADINILNTKGESALTLALKSENKPLITALLENAYNIEIDQIDGDGNTPLMLAIETDDLKIIEQIVGEVPNPKKKNSKNKTAYDFFEGKMNDTSILSLLVDAEKQYALYEAIKKQDLTAIKNSDASLLNITSAERNPLVTAFSQRNKGLAEAIINKGADVNQILRGNKTPLWQAALSANNDTFKFLLEKGAKPNVADIYDEYTPIFPALHNNRSVLVQYLIDNKANKANVNYQASSKFPGKPGKITPLMFVVSENAESDFVKILLDAGADPLMQNSEGKTALDLARENEKATQSPSARENYQKIITLLEEKIKTIPPSKPSIPTKPSTPVTPTTTPTTSAQLMSLLQNLTQQLRMLLKVLQKK